jgi:hypothetical protein
MGLRFAYFLLFATASIFFAFKAERPKAASSGVSIKWHQNA